jgi:hypothetical protein
MALTVEDGTGLTNAESYLSVADTDTYLANHGNPTVWSSASTAQKEESLRLATQYLDAQYGARWKGRRSNEDQRLNWPREGVVDADAYVIDTDEMPQALKDACAEMAYRHRNGEPMLADLESSDRSIKRERVKAGPVEEEKEYFGAKPTQKRYPLVDLLLRPLLRSTQMVERG